MQADPEKSLEYFASAAKQGAGAGLRCRSGQPACGLHPRPSRVRGRACSAALVSLHVVCIRGQAGCWGGPALPLWSGCIGSAAHGSSC